MEDYQHLNATGSLPARCLAQVETDTEYSSHLGDSAARGSGRSKTKSKEDALSSIKTSKKGKTFEASKFGTEKRESGQNGEDKKIVTTLQLEKRGSEDKKRV